MWELMSSYLGSGARESPRLRLVPRHNRPPSLDVHTIQRAIVNHVEYTLASTRFNFDDNKAYRATAHRRARARGGSGARAAALTRCSGGARLRIACGTA